MWANELFVGSIFGHIHQETRWHWLVIYMVDSIKRSQPIKEDSLVALYKTQMKLI